ncbi:MULTISPECIES: sulfurtransferase complex subunit TusB [Thermoanaerobacterium]|uniref:Sulfur relay protein TusB/DsrH n=1 Tax=Thermoanaerobacterium xylanolyticum (strain ATCC 49914 / DSM 7097 / LX-11) TaxID=858215 RepID=F6BJG2_THEXL|nr:sulfurtransferase complex subunit TusB [Thermoanaerobacterium xylanolyticum]AEF16930.1 sulfur relay protein TusB/DsrH [Thermoanaerobacterium xylanolyticum LX-11]
MALIIVKKSPDAKISEFLLKLALPQDKVIFIQDGVIFAIEKNLKNFIKEGIELFALKEDFIARGFEESESQIPLIDYERWADFIEMNEKIIS